jgi:hypothetical protein
MVAYGYLDAAVRSAHRAFPPRQTGMIVLAHALTLLGQHASSGVNADVRLRVGRLQTALRNRHLRTTAVRDAGI